MVRKNTQCKTVLKYYTYLGKDDMTLMKKFLKSKPENPRMLRDLRVF